MLYATLGIPKDMIASLNFSKAHYIFSQFAQHANIVVQGYMAGCVLISGNPSSSILGIEDEQRPPIEKIIREKGYKGSIKYTSKRRSP